MMHREHEKEPEPETELEEEELERKSPLRIILALLLVFILLVLFIPVYKIRVDPEPNHEKIPSLDSLLAELALINASTASHLKSIDEALSIENMPIIREAAVKISTSACRESKICHVKALYYFTRDKIGYVEDPAKEYIQHPTETLVTGGGDCEDKALLLAYLLKAIDVPSRICLTYDHAFIEAWLPEARAGYKTEDDWIALDAASDLDFGKINSYANVACDIYI